MKVYIVTSQHTDFDGWSLGDKRIVKAFTDSEKAREFMLEETGKRSATEYGYAEVEKAGWYFRWSIEELEVEK